MPLGSTVATVSLYLSYAKVEIGRVGSFTAPPGSWRRVDPHHTAAAPPNAPNAIPVSSWPAIPTSEDGLAPSAGPRLTINATHRPAVGRGPTPLSAIPHKL